MEANATCCTSRRSDLPEIYAYTDGACSGNPGPGGWGVLLLARDGTTVVRKKEICGGEAQTTNNRMELTAAIRALEALSSPSRITVVTDSRYVKDGITKWIANWKRKNWMSASGGPVKNRDLWERLDEMRSLHRVSWQWIKGHRGHPENERSDELARRGMKSFLDNRPKGAAAKASRAPS